MVPQEKLDDPDIPTLKTQKMNGFTLSSLQKEEKIDLESSLNIEFASDDNKEDDFIWDVLN